jgi:hypothetical protein
MTQPLLSLTTQTKLEWGARFPLSDSFMQYEQYSGIYLWGFDSPKGEVIWYVGKSKKGVHSRLAKHYLDIMSGQYQIPTGFLNDGFKGDECAKGN